MALGFHLAVEETSEWIKCTLRLVKREIKEFFVLLFYHGDLTHPNVWSLQRKELNKSENGEKQSTVISNESNALIRKKRGRRKL